MAHQMPKAGAVHHITVILREEQSAWAAANRAKAMGVIAGSLEAMDIFDPVTILFDPDWGKVDTDGGAHYDQ